MRLEDFMDIHDIKLNLESKTKTEVIKELANFMNQKGNIDDLEALTQDVLNREALGTTGIGLKIAMPHAKTAHIKVPSVVFGRSDDGIEFDSLDGEKAHLFFLICIPESGVNLHLKVLAMLSRSLIHESFRNELLEARNVDDIINILKRVE
ncbi:MAG: PTS sugar transporter subunit IIA [Acholeplasmataceae bacterium]